MAAGIDTRHARSCRSRGEGGRCNCTPTYQAHVFDNRGRKRIRRTFPTHAAAKMWRQDALIALRSGGLVPARTPSWLTPSTPSSKAWTTAPCSIARGSRTSPPHAAPTASEDLNRFLAGAHGQMPA